MAHVGSVVDGIVNWPVATGGLGLVVASWCMVVRVGIATWGATVVHVPVRVIVPSAGSCKVLQVSNHCPPKLEWAYKEKAPM